MESNAYDGHPLTGTAPTGTVTFVFTDIEGSTRLWEQYPQAMRAVVARHDALLKQAIEAQGGYFVKSTGDGCLAAFRTAGSAIASALAMQRALTADAWTEIQPRAVRVRVGVHTGEAEARAGDYYGTAVNRAARLMAVGHGGQVLVSNTTAELARDELPAEVSLIDLGECRLKDLVRPEHIYQMAHPDLAATFPSIQSLDAYPHNLPIQLTSFVGREREMSDVKRILESTRLLTLTGTGGTGKTRLSLQLAADVLPGFKDGAWLVELASLDNPDGIVQMIAGVFELRDLRGQSLLNLVTDYLRGKQLLLILDNCEHLIDAVVRLSDHLLHACPHLQLLVTSREALGIAGEVSYRVPSLGLPEESDAIPQTLAACESVQLFVERAVAANPRFALSGDNAAAVAQVCRRLDGIPLALELAAARTRAFSVEQIAARLDDRFRLLTGGSRAALPRQQTLRALIDWSYELLPEVERRLLRTLSVCVGGWSLEAAEAMCPQLDVLELLPQLVNKSLVLADEQAGQVRYRLLETIRQYARDRLLEVGESASARDSHLDYFLGLSKQAEPQLRGEHALDWYDRLDPDYDNLQAAMEWGQESRPEDALRLAGNLIFFLPYHIVGGHSRVDVLRWLKKTVERLESLPAVMGTAAYQRANVKARALLIMAVLNMSQGNRTEAETRLNEAIAITRDLNDKFLLAIELSNRSTLGWFRMDLVTVQSAATEAMRLLDEIGERRWQSHVLMHLAAVARSQGDMQAWQHIREEVNARILQIDHPSTMLTLLGMSMSALSFGDWEVAQIYTQQGLRLAKRMKDKGFSAAMESLHAHITRLRGNFQEAAAEYRRTIRVWLGMGQAGAVANQLECMAYIARTENELPRAARLLGAAEALRDVVQEPMATYERPEYEREVAALHSQMDAAELAAAWAEGRAMSMEQAVAYALAAEEPNTAVGGKPVP